LGLEVDLEGLTDPIEPGLELKLDGLSDLIIIRFSLNEVLEGRGLAPKVC